MKRILEIVWGIVLVLVSLRILWWIAYSYTYAEKPPRYPWWWSLVLVVLWGYGVFVGIRRIRGRDRSKERAKIFE
ncbi:MAG: hypothetical protein ACKVX7_07980 [Planctomycetota bacterium]